MERHSDGNFFINDISTLQTKQNERKFFKHTLIWYFLCIKEIQYEQITKKRTVWIRTRNTKLNNRSIKINKTPIIMARLPKKKNIISSTLWFHFFLFFNKHIRMNQKMPEAKISFLLIFFELFEKQKKRYRKNTCVHAYNWAHVSRCQNIAIYSKMLEKILYVDTFKSPKIGFKRSFFIRLFNYIFVISTCWRPVVFVCSVSLSPDSS